MHVTLDRTSPANHFDLEFRAYDIPVIASMLHPKTSQEIYKMARAT